MVLLVLNSRFWLLDTLFYVYFSIVSIFCSFIMYLDVGTLISIYIVRPILTQLDYLQSVEKVSFSTFAGHDILPRKCWKMVFLASARVGAFPKIYPELFPASPGAQLQEITVSTFSSQLGYLPRSDRKIYSVVYICSIRSEIAIVFDPVGSKKC